MQLRVDGRQVPWSLPLSALCWLMPGVWSGLGTLIPSLLVPPEVRDSGWFGPWTLAVLAGYTVVVIGLPILMLYRSRAARGLLTLVAAWFAVAVVAAPSLEPTEPIVRPRLRRGRAGSNTDRGSQFRSRRFVESLRHHGLTGALMHRGGGPPIGAVPRRCPGGSYLPHTAQPQVTWLR